MPVVYGHAKCIKTRHIQEAVDLDPRFKVSFVHDVKSNILVISGVFEPAKTYIGCNGKFGAEVFSPPQQFPELMCVKEINISVGQKFVHPLCCKTIGGKYGKHSVCPPSIVQV